MNIGVKSVKRSIAILAMMFAIVIIATSMASAQTLEFEQNATAGDVLNGKIDIVKIGGYVQEDYQYFYVETRDAGLAAPPDGDMYSLTIKVEANVNGEDTTDYVDIIITWQNNDGVVNTTGIFTTASGGLTSLGNEDIIVSGNRVTARVPSMLLQNVEVLNVEFATVDYSDSVAWDDVFYYPSSSGNGGSDDSGSSGGSTDEGTGTYEEPDFGTLALVAGTASLACTIGWFVVWLLIAIWAYSNAKKKCNEHPIIWFLVVFFLGIIGLIIYVIVVKDECQKKQMAQMQSGVPPPPS